MKPGQQNGGAAEGQHRVDAYAQTKAVKHRHHGKHPITGQQTAAGIHALQCQGIEIQVGQQDTLWLAGGASGVKHCCTVSAFAHIGDGSAGLLHECVPIHPVMRFPFYADPVCNAKGQGHKAVRGYYYNSIRRQTLQLFCNAIQCQNHFAAAELQMVFYFAPGGKGVDHICHRPQLIEGIKDDYRLGHIWQDHRHAVSLLDMQAA